MVNGGGMDGRTDGRMDGHLEIPPRVLQDIGPLGPLPKKGLVSEVIYWEKRRLLQTKNHGEWGFTFGMKKILGERWRRTFFEDENKRQSKKKGLVNEDIYWEKKKTASNMRLWWVRTNFWDGKKSLRNNEWGHFLKIKTKGYQRKRVWWVRTSMERKKTTTNKRLWWVRTHFWDEKKSLEMVSEDILWREKQKTIKEKRFCEWGHLWRKKRLLQTKDYGEWGHNFGIKKILKK